mmetsp:Transcript_6317/g.15346  ORF Transcript_6317/g.15346 Transcript_6317/m.15346 type:complete len:233 (+) Transcript_6317:509-1207(+)
MAFCISCRLIALDSSRSASEKAFIAFLSSMSSSSNVRSPASGARFPSICGATTFLPLNSSSLSSNTWSRCLSFWILSSRSISLYLCWNLTPMMEMGRPRTKMPLRPAMHATNSPHMVLGIMSPYPTVVTDTMLKYIERAMDSKAESIFSRSGFSQKYIPLLIIMTAMTRRTARTDSSIRHVLKVVASTRTPWEYFPSLNTRPMMRNTRARRSARSTIALDDSSTRGTSMMPM